jgi:hypothetical protein
MTAMERACNKAANGIADDLHEILKREDSTLGRAYKKISDTYDSIETSMDRELVWLAEAMDELRQLIIMSEATQFPPRSSRLRGKKSFGVKS